MNLPTWKERLADRMPEALGEEIDVFETQMTLRRQGRLDEKIFAETRLRRGAVRPALRQRPAPRRRRGPHARLSRRRAHQGAGHAVGRARHAAHQDPDGPAVAPSSSTCWPSWPRSTPTPSCTSRRARTSSCTSSTSRTRRTCMRRLAAVGITTREACGNSVRNVTACPFAGVCNDRGVRRHAVRARAHLLPARPPRHAGLRPQVQDRLLRLQAARRAGWPTSTTSAPSPRSREVDGKVRARLRALRRRRPGRGAAAGQAARRVRARGGAAAAGPGDVPRVRAARRAQEPRPRAAQVRGRRSSASRSSAAWCSRSATSSRRTSAGPRTSTDLDDVERDAGAAGPRARRRRARSGGSRAGARRNVRPQRQPGYVVATVTLPLGDLTSTQARALADLARRYTGDTIRLTVEQNLVLRWVPRGGPPGAAPRARRPSASALPGAATIGDITACPGTDTCKLGISSSRGLAGELRERLAARARGRTARATIRCACTSR